MTTDNNQPFKTRSLSVQELFDVLQQEYIVCELRAKIYPITKHKEYWTDLMEKKKEKILNISKRNNLFSIFDNEKIKQGFEQKIIPEVGFPNFLYKDPTQKLIQEKWDIHNYYYPKTSVKVFVDSSNVLTGTIQSVDFPSNRIKVSIDGITQEFDINLITRVL
jgi:hypothetical protein